MYHFYTDSSSIGEKQIVLTGEDVNHIKNVLRMREGEKLVVCDGEGMEYLCSIGGFTGKEVVADIIESRASESELPLRMVLFQGLPKKDKMELIIQKAVELGVAEIVPVLTKRVIVKLEDEKKELKKTERWQAIAESAAKQSGRGIIPKILRPMSYKDALKYASELDMNIIPYENAEGMDRSRELVKLAKDKKSLGIFIGPEGGFEPSEIEQAEAQGVETMTLGRRILRTETAGLAILSVIMFETDA